MSFNVSSLSQYIDQSSTELLVNMVAGANTFDSPVILVKEGIKGGSIEEIPLFSNQLEFQPGNCVSTPSGGTTFTKVQLGTTTFTHYDEFCGQDLSARFPKLLRAGATSEIDMPTVVMDDYTKQTQNLVAKAAWQGLYNGYTSDLSIAGWLQQLVNTSISGSTYKKTIGTTFSAGNAVQMINEFVSSRPTALYAESVEVRMGPEDFEALKQGYISANNYHFDPTADKFRMPLNGFTDVVAVADFGLAGSKAIVAVATNGLAFGCDLKSDKDSIATDYDKRLNKTWLRITMSIGAKVAKPGDIGVFLHA